MKTLALRIYLTVVAVLLVFALIAGWLAQRHIAQERNEMQSQTAFKERAVAWGELFENSLPPATAPDEEQARVFLDWANRLHQAMALDGVDGQRIATSAEMLKFQSMPDSGLAVMQSTLLSDGRTLWVMRPPPRRGHAHGPERAGEHKEGPGGPSPAPAHRHLHDEVPWLGAVMEMLPGTWADGVPAVVISLALLFVAVAIGAWPVATHLTRRLKALRDGVEAFGSGQLQQRVEVEGRDEVAELARSFNEAAQRIEGLITSNRSLLANASHELRSPLARLKMAVSIMADMPAERAAQLKVEIHQDIRELDSLVEEVLLASRLDTRRDIEHQPVDLLGLVTEEAQRVGAQVLPVQAAEQPYPGDDRLLRRAVRNLLENAKRYGGSDIEVALVEGPLSVEIKVSDRGPGVPPDQRERIFEPFYRMPGHAEHAGGVGLGLSLVRQIAERHNGRVRCEAREGGGSRFVITLPQVYRKRMA